MNKTKEKIFNIIDNYLLVIPIIFAMAVIPLIVRVNYYYSNMLEYSWFGKDIQLMDMFLYYKNQAMILLDGVLVVGYVYLLARKKLRVDLNFLPLLIYLILAVFSTITSISPEHTWHGFFGMFETAYVIFGYAMICYFAYSVVRTEKQLKFVMGGFAIGILVMGAIAISQFIGMDIYASDFGKDLIFPERYAIYKDSLKILYGKGWVYASLYNPNYVGVYSALLVPFLFVLLFSVKERIQAVLFTILMAIVMVCWVGSNSQASVLAIFPVGFFTIVYFGKKHWKNLIVAIIVCGVIFVGLNVYQGENNTFRDTIDKFESTSTDKEVEEKAKVKKLTDITLNDTDYTVTYNGEVLTIKHLLTDGNQFSIAVLDSSGNTIETLVNDSEDGYVLNDEKYDGLEFIFGLDQNNNIGFSVKEGAKSFFIYYSNREQTYFYTNLYGHTTKIYSSETFYSPVFKLAGGFSGRDFIWGKSIPLLKKTVILGSGPDTFAFMFPQYDYVSLIQDGWSDKLITKPHSLYLQMGVETGVLSMVAFLVFNICYLVQSLKLYYKRTLSSFTERFGAGVFMADISYLIIMLANDSTIGVSIVYWSLVGLGFACNAIVRRKDAEKSVKNEMI